MINDDQNPSLAEALDAEVSRFHRRAKMQFMRPLTLLISDFEFEYDMASLSGATSWPRTTQPRVGCAGRSTISWPVRG